jgi:hypothetical protein
MLMKRFFTNVFCLFLIANAAFAQNNTMEAPHGVCGTQDLDLIKERLFENRYALENGLIIEERGAKKYVPVKFHLIAKADKTGRVSELKVLENLCQMNLDYADQDIVFYLKGGTFSYIDNDIAYTDPGKVAQLLQTKRDGGSINVFIALNATNEGTSALGGVTLGYYSPSRDWLVIKKDQMNSTSGTVSHEFGHYFSLLHPHNGWDQKSFLQEYFGDTGTWSQVPAYFKVTNPTSPGGVPIECFNGSNCKSAGDFMCDTPADYNFGFGWNACNVFDRKLIGPCDKDTIKDVDETLYMAYFIGCKDYHFSAEQKKAVSNDYGSNKRSYIRSTFVPTAGVAGPAKLVYPYSASVATPIVHSPFDNVDLVWEAVPNATNYIVELDRINNYSSAEFQRFYVPATQLKQTIKNLKPNLTYYWRVIPYSDGGLCIDWNKVSSLGTNFKTGTLSATNEFNGLNGVMISPNPVSQNSDLTLTLNIEKPVNCQINLIDVAGKTVINYGEKALTAGFNNLNLPLQNVAHGVYFVRINVEGKPLTRKVIVAE